MNIKTKILFYFFIKLIVWSIRGSWKKKNLIFFDGQKKMIKRKIKYFELIFLKNNFLRLFGQGHHSPPTLYKEFCPVNCLDAHFFASLVIAKNSCMIWDSAKGNLFLPVSQIQQTFPYYLQLSLLRVECSNGGLAVRF